MARLFHYIVMLYCLNIPLATLMLETIQPFIEALGHSRMTFYFLWSENLGMNGYIKQHII